MAKYTVRVYKNGKGKYSNMQMLADKTFDTDEDVIEDIGSLAGSVVEEAVRCDFYKGSATTPSDDRRTDDAPF